MAGDACTIKSCMRTSEQNARAHMCAVLAHVPLLRQTHAFTWRYYDTTTQHILDNNNMFAESKMELIQ